MALTNLSNTHLSPAEVTAAQNAITALESALVSVNINLSPDERRKYGSINEQNKLFVNKVNDYNVNQPSLSAPEVDWAEFTRDHTSRLTLEAMIARLENLTTQLINAKTLHDFDNYQTALTDYAYTSYKAGTAAPGFETKLNDLKQFFSKSAKNVTPPATEQ